MSYRIKIDRRSQKAGRFVLQVQRELQGALERSGLRQSQLADKLGVDKSIVNRRLTGRANLTLRSIADIAWALDQDVSLSMKPHEAHGKPNERPQVSSVLSTPMQPLSDQNSIQTTRTPPSPNKVVIKNASA